MENELLIKLRKELRKNLEEKAARFDEEYSYLLHERDTSDVWRQFAIWLLVDEDHGVIRYTQPGSPQYNAIQQVAQLYIEDCKDADAWKAAAAAAWSAADTAYDAFKAAWSSAWYAATAAAYSAYSAYFAYASGYASYAADASGSAADATATAAAAAADAAAAYTWSAAHYGRMADKLIELLQAAPMMKETV